MRPCRQAQILLKADINDEEMYLSLLRTWSLMSLLIS